MTKHTIRSILFFVSIAVGLGVGYVCTSVSKYAYAHVISYISEIRTPLVFEQKREEGLGGPYAQIIESDFNQTIDVYTKNFIIKNQDNTSRVSSLSYLVADLETGKVLLSQNINQQLPIASISKLMTAIVAEENFGLDTQTSITQQAVDTYGTQGNLRKGEKYSVQELFYPLLLESSNDAAEALAYTKSRESFISDMNGKAKSIGLLNTSFEDASGLSANNVSTVTDLFRLTQYISKYRSYIFDITTLKNKKIGKKTWNNNSRFRNDRDYVGGKNGYIDEARKTHIVLFDESFDKSNRTIVYIVLRSDDISYDIKMLRDFVYKNVDYR
jgi:D-alanyl-D-alanine carboxypeptidase (penicillin-binding protein 5/6)